MNTEELTDIDVPKTEDWVQDYKGMKTDQTLRIEIHKAILESLSENGVDITRVNHNDIRRTTYRFLSYEKKIRKEERKRISWCIRDRAKHSLPREVTPEMIARYVEQGII